MAKARDFPGTSGANISITDPAGILVNAAWTCLMWVNPATLAADGAIIVRVGSVNATTRGVGLGTQAAGRLRIDSGAQAVAGAVGSPLVVSTWQRIGYRKAAAGVSQMLVTLNGVDVGSEATDAPPALATGDVFQVSDATASYGRANFDGQVAFLAWVQGVALSAAQQDAYLQDPEQLVTDYGPLGAVTPDALKVYWPMQCDTATEEDESGVGNNGTRNGTVPLVLTGPTPTTAWDPCAAALPAPTISSIDPVTGAPAGGTPCTLTGTGFVDGATVTFDGVAATGVTWVSATRIDCISPAHAAGAVDVVVTNPDTQTGTLAGGFTYAAVTLAGFEVLEESEAPLDDFRVGTAKNVLILAIGSDGQIFTDFTGTVEVSASGSNISGGSGTTAAFVAGELVHAVTFDQLATNITLGVADTATGTDTGTSAAFDVTLPAASAGGSALIGGPSPLIG